MIQKSLVIGGRSRIARALRKLYPGSYDYVFRTALSQKAVTDGLGSTELVIDSYKDLSAEDMKGYATVINLVGATRGTPKELMAVNAELPMRFAIEAARAGVAHFISFSSFSVYGAASRIGPATPLTPHTVYGLSRLAGERNIAQLADRMRCTIVRCPLLYGDGDSKLENLISLWCRVGIIPTPSVPVHRSMAHYDLAAQYINDMAWSQPENRGLTIDHFADPVTFEYRRVAGTLSAATGMRKRLILFPSICVRLFDAISPELSRSLFSDSVLESGYNHYDDPSHSRLYQDIARMALSGGGSA